MVEASREVLVVGVEVVVEGPLADRGGDHEEVVLEQEGDQPLQPAGRYFDVVVHDAHQGHAGGPDPLVPGTRASQVLIVPD